MVALVLANSPFSAPLLKFWKMPIGLQVGQLDFTRSLHHWINDALMTLFFFIVSLELKREFALGELRNPRAAALPFLAALGGMAVPVSIYLVLMNGQPGVHGWGTVMATDTAFVIGGLALFGSSIPAQLRIFLVSLAIFDDVGAISVVAVAYGETLNFGALGLAMLGLAVVAISARIGIRSIPVYFVLGGGIWLCFDASGLHATIAGVILGLMTPARAWVGDERLRSIMSKLTAHPTGEHWSGDTSERHDLRETGRAIEESLSLGTPGNDAAPLGRVCGHAYFCTGQRRCGIFGSRSGPAGLRCHLRGPGGRQTDRCPAVRMVGGALPCRNTR